MRLSNHLLDAVISRIHKNHSINKISRDLVLAKSTVYYYYQKIKGRKYPVLTLHPAYSQTEGEIVGIFAGDGSLYFDRNNYHYEIKIIVGTNNQEYGLYVKDLFDTYFGKRFEFTHNTPWAYRVKTSSKVISGFFSHYLVFNPSCKHSTVRLISTNLPEEFLRGFLKGLLDTDGCVYRTKYSTFSLSYSTTSRKLAFQLQEILSSFHIKSSIYERKPVQQNWKMQYSVQIWKGDAERFLTQVKPWKARKYTAGW